jgi:hypothetical protein
MPSEAFQKFQREYASEGRAKLDGYTLPNLDRLSPEEKREAFDLLGEEVARFPQAADAMARIAPERAVEHVRAVVDRLDGDARLRAFHLDMLLWRWTGADAHLERVKQAALRLSGFYRSDALAQLRDVPSGKGVEDVLERLILEERDPDERDVQISELLDRLRVEVTPQRFRELRDAIGRANAAELRELVRSLRGSGAR